MNEEHEETDPQGRAAPAPPEVTLELFAEWRAPRLGTSNPERMDNPVWKWLIETEMDAFSASNQMGGFDPFELGPGWCFQRYGQSATTLPDGRRVLIGGEHEDFYDPDFFIYNDVVVKHPDGRVEIYGYPADLFPPTDFHSATLVGSQILLLGALGYPERRKPGCTPAFLLDTETFSMRRMETRGDGPGWIHKHQADVGADGESIVLTGGLIDDGLPNSSFQENIDQWGLSLPTGQWSRLTSRDWARWEFGREDGAPHQLMDFELARAMEMLRGAPSLEALEGLESFVALRSEMPSKSAEELKLFQALFKPDLAGVEILPDSEGPTAGHRIRWHGVVVRYREGPRSIQLIVEGELPEDLAGALVDDFAAKFTLLMKAPCWRKRH